MKTQDKIINAFMDLAKDTELHNITIKDISKKAGINRSTFYNYYFDIDDLIKELEDNIISRLVSDAKKYISDEAFTINNIYDLILHIFPDYEEYLYIFIIKNNDLSFYTRLKKEFFPLLEAQTKINENIKYYDYIISYTFNAILGLITHWYETGKNLSPEEFINLLIKLIKSGVSEYTLQ